MFKMDCGCFYNSRSFKVGRKYLYELSAYSDKVLAKVELTPSVIADLKKIKEQYRYDDARRTLNVLAVIDGDYGNYDYKEED